MTNSVKRLFAKEWLILLGSLAVGLGICGPIAAWCGGNDPSDFYSALFDDEVILAWSLSMIPYALVQSYRMTAWAIRIIRLKDHP